MIKFRKVKSESFGLIDRLPEVFEKYLEIGVVYLFGSSVSERRSPLSDIDIAYVVERDKEDKFKFDREMELSVEISEVLRTEEVDVVKLNHAPLSFRYSVIKSGKELFCRDKKLKENFEAETIVRYLDFKPVREGYFKELFNKIGEKNGC